MNLQKQTFIRAVFAAASLSILLGGCGGGGSVTWEGDEDVDPANVPDAVPKYEPKSRYGNPKSYVVFGKRYYKLDSAKGFVQRGTASWYGPKFHGRKTSNGEVFDMYQMTAAHKRLPLPTYVQVTNLRNGKKIVVRVNDHGPFHGDRIIDLSYMAAVKLGMDKAGTAPVEVRAITPGEPIGQAAPPPKQTPSAARRSGKVFVQVGAFLSEVNAEKLRQSLLADNFPSARVSRSLSNGQTLFRVRLGPLQSESAGQRLAAQLTDAGHAGPKVVID